VLCEDPGLKKAFAEAIPDVSVVLGHVYSHQVGVAHMVEFYVDMIHDIDKIKSITPEISIQDPAGSTNLAECVFHQ
jgi:hypothetical protein